MPALLDAGGAGEGEQQNESKRRPRVSDASEPSSKKGNMGENDPSKRKAQK